MTTGGCTIACLGNFKSYPIYADSHSQDAMTHHLSSLELGADPLLFLACSIIDKLRLELPRGLVRRPRLAILAKASTGFEKAHPSCWKRSWETRVNDTKNSNIALVTSKSQQVDLQFAVQPALATWYISETTPGFVDLPHMYSPEQDLPRCLSLLHSVTCTNSKGKALTLWHKSACSFRVYLLCFLPSRWPAAF